MDWEYGGIYKNYDMSGEIKIGTGVVKVHDIFEPLPEFMLQADIVFSDPPCSKANINSFYTKADRLDHQESYDPFRRRFFECIDQISPRVLFVEVFKSNYDYFYVEICRRYSNIHIYESMYYNNKKNKCWIIQGQKSEVEPLCKELIDEEKFIKLLCETIDYNNIGDLCMGKGLVGFYSNVNGKRFVGTELNKKRLAVLLERINTMN